MAAASGPGLSRRMLCLAKVEATMGTDPTPTVTQNVFLMYNEANPLNPDTKQIEMKAMRPTFTSRGKLPGRTLLNFNPKTFLQGSGSPSMSPYWGPFLQACGTSLLSQSSSVAGSSDFIFTPLTSGWKTTAAYLWMENVKWIVLALVGNAAITYNAGQGINLDFTLQGKYPVAGPATDTMPTNQVEPPENRTLIQSENLKIGTYGGDGATTGVLYRGFTFNTGNTLKELDDTNSPYGFGGVWIVDRLMTLEVRLQAEIDLSHLDVFAKVQQGEKATPITSTHGTVAGQSQTLFTFDDPYWEKVAYVDNGGIRDYTLSLTGQNSTNDGEWNITQREKA